MKACPRCGESNLDTARFCSSCGTRFGAEAPAREERKIVSILFVDLVGFTAQSDRADPEDVRDLLHLYHARVRDEAERFGGTVEKFIGDAVMAVFGAPVAHTDDAERAVRAGLAALGAVQDLNRQRPGLDRLSARAAVNTGEAVVALGSGHLSGEALAIGDVVNTASRLQGLAPGGRLVVGDETYRWTRDAVRYEALEPAEAKGKRDPLKAWVAVELLPSRERRLGTSPLVGRGRELALLESVWESATEQNRPHLVTVLGPAGIGKSRLSREFASVVAAHGGRSIRGRCLPYDTRDVYGAFAEQVKDVAQIFEQDAPRSARAKLLEAVAGLLPQAEQQEVARCISLMLGLGLDQPVDEQVLLLYSARRFVEGLGARQPTLLVFEDVQWADPSQLDLILYLARQVRDAPVVLLALARPELLDARPAWGSGARTHTTISLEPVSGPDAAVLVGNLVGEELTPHALGRLLDVAGGNPLFIEELVAGLLEGADTGALPTSVRAAIAARVDALPAEQRSALLAASVVGKVFWGGALTALGGIQDVEGTLDALEARDLVRRAPTSRVVGDVEYSFKHILIRDVCYGTLPRAERRAAHAAVARFIEKVTGQMDRELAWLLAYHWEQAAEPRLAIDYLLLAAERSQEAMAVNETFELLERARGLAPDDQTRTRVQLLLGLARSRFEDFDRAALDLEPLVPTLTGRDRLEALHALARSYHWTEQTERTIAAAQEALALAEESGDSELVAMSMARLSQGHAMRGHEGDIDRAIELGERALQVWIPGARPEDMAEHEHLLADQHYWTAGYPRAMELSRAARDKAVDPGSAEALLRAGGMEGLLLASMGRYEEAFASFDRVIALGRTLGRPIRVILNYSTLAYRDLYDLDEARGRSEESLATQARSSSFHMPWMNAEVDLVQTDLMAGEIGAAEVRWKRMWDEVLATPAWERWFLGGKMAAFRAEMALASGSYEEAAEWATTALEKIMPVRRAKYESVARTVLGRALAGLGRTQEARRELQAAVAIADRLGTPPLRWRSRQHLASLLVDIGDDNEAESAFREAVRIVREVESGLSPERASRFVAAPQVAELLRAAR